MARNFKIKTLDDYRKQMTTSSSLIAPLTRNQNEVPTIETLKTQRDNLDKRLKSVGVDAQNLKDSEIDNRGIVKKALNLDQDQGFLFDFLEVIDRPTRAIFGAIDSAVRGENLVEGAWEGLSGQKKAYTTDILDELNILDKNSLHPLQELAFNLVPEIYMNPIRYMPRGFIRQALGMKGSYSTQIVKVREGLDVAEEAFSLKFDTIKATSGFQKGVSSAQGFIDPTTGFRVFDDTALNTYRQSYEKIAQKLATGEKLKAGELYEYYGVRVLRAKLKSKFPDIDVLKFATNDPNTPDLAFFKSFVDPTTGQKYWFNFNNIEIKGVADLGKKLEDVRYLQTRIHLSRAADGSDFVNFDFSDDILNEISPNLLKDLEAVFNTKIEGLYRGKGAGKLSISVEQLFEEANQVKTLVTDVVEGSKSAFPKIKELGLKVQKSSYRSLVTSNNYKTVAKVKERLIALNPQADARLIDEAVDIIMKQRTAFQNSLSKLNLVSYQPTHNIDLDAYEGGVRKLVKTILKDKYVDNPYIMYVDRLGQSKVLHTSEILDKLDITSAKFNVQPGGGFRLYAGLGSKQSLDDLMFTDAFDDFILSLVDDSANLTKLLDATPPLPVQETYKDVLVTTKKPAKILEFIGTKALDEKSILQKPAKFANDLMTKLKYKFDAGAGYGLTFKNQLGRILGEEGYELYRSVTKLNEKEKILKQLDPAAGRYVKDIFELNITPEMIRSGNIPRFINREMATYDILEYYFRTNSMGKHAILDSFATPLDRQNAEVAINQFLKANQIEAVARINVGKNLGEVLVLDTDLDLMEIKKLLKDTPLVQTQYLKVNFGNMEVDQKFIDFVLANQDDFVEVYNLQAEMVERIINNIGVENLPDAVLSKLGYYRHTLTKEAKQYLRESGPISRSMFSREGSSLFSAKEYQASTDSINRALRDLMDIDYDTITADGFDSLRELIEATLHVESQNKVLGAILRESVILDEVGAQTSFFQVIDNSREAAADLGPAFEFIADPLEVKFAKLFDNLSEDSLKVWKEFMTDMGYVQGKSALAINKSVYETLSGLNRAYTEVNEFIKYYDSFQNFWKSVTLISPGFHMRNFFGNMTNMYVAGMTTPDIFKYNTQSIMDFNDYFKYRDVLTLEGIDAVPEGVRKSVLRVKDYFDGGMAQTRKGLRDLEKMQSLALQGYDPSVPHAKRLYNELVKANFNAAEYIDDIQRYSMYNWALNQNNLFPDLARLKSEGASTKLIDKYKQSMARNKVLEALFDYTNLTLFEKDVMKRLFPFYTFMKNNFIFQMKSFIDAPAKYTQIGKAFDYWNEQMGGISREDMPRYAQDYMWLALPFNVDKNDEKAISFLKLNLTPSDFALIVDQPLKRGLTSLAAPLKIPIEYAFMRDSFTGREFEKFPGEAKRLSPDEGVLPFLRDQRGTLAISSNPSVQKLINDLGLRVPQNYLSIAFDILDGLAGYQGFGETVSDIVDRLSLTRTQEVSQMELTRLYQDLEQLRNLKSLYEQESGERLPSLEELTRGSRIIP